MKKLTVIVLCFLFISCKTQYYEYDLFNKSSSNINVKIETTGGPYLSYIEYFIEPEQTVRIFEFEAYGEYANHKTLVPMKENCKYITSMTITNESGNKSKKDFNNNNCCNFRIFKGLTGQQGIYTLTLEDIDFN